jgi:hypothetical protein
MMDGISIGNKRQEFSEEDEVRMVFSIDKYNYEQVKRDKLVKFREINGIMIPFIDIKFDKECVKGIKISPTYQEELAKEGVRIMLDNKMYDHISNNKITISDIPFRYSF